jgi:hypothetical protein
MGLNFVILKERKKKKEKKRQTESQYVFFLCVLKLIYWLGVCETVFCDCFS